MVIKLGPEITADVVCLGLFQQISVGVDDVVTVKSQHMLGYIAHYPEYIRQDESDSQVPIANLLATLRLH